MYRLEEAARLTDEVQHRYDPELRWVSIIDSSEESYFGVFSSNVSRLAARKRRLPSATPNSSTMGTASRGGQDRRQRGHPQHRGAEAPVVPLMQAPSRTDARQAQSCQGDSQRAASIMSMAGPLLSG